MKTTGIRVEVPQSLYEKLIDEQQKQKLHSQRKPSLASIIIDICENKLNCEENEHNNLNFEQESVRNNVHSAQNIVQYKSNNLISDHTPERRYNLWEEHLTQWESSLREKESYIKEKEDELFDEKEEVYKMKNDLLEQKDKFRQEILAGPEKIVETKLLEYELENKNKKLSEILEELAELKREYHKVLKQSETKKETSTFWDQVKANLPVIIAGAGILGAYLLNRKKGKSKIDPQLSKVAEILDQLDPKDKNSLGKILLAAADKHKKEKTSENKSVQ